MKRMRNVGQRRRDVGVGLSIERWNRPDPVKKRCMDLLAQIRTYLAHVNETDLIGFARLLYLKHSTRPGIAEEYAAISSGITLMNFIEKYESINDVPLDIAELEQMAKRAESQGLDFGKKGQDVKSK
jgi:hypothetical protein